MDAGLCVWVCVYKDIYKDNITARYIISFSSYARRPHLFIYINVALYVLIVNRIYRKRAMPGCKLSDFGIFTYTLTKNYSTFCKCLLNYPYSPCTRVVWKPFNFRSFAVYVHTSTWRQRELKEQDNKRFVRLDVFFFFFVHSQNMCVRMRKVYRVGFFIFPLCTSAKKNAMKRSIQIFWKKSYHMHKGCATMCC